MGMVQYYHSFLPNLATTFAPLHKLFKKDAQWKWTSECQKAYDVCKQSPTSDTLLVHYDLNRKLRLACDASSYGLGAVLSHVLDNGQERPIAYASRTLSQTEKNYAQIEREALSIVFGVKKKFHQFLYGRNFTLITDHKPLLAILGPRSAITTLAAARMQRWALILSAYDYVIEYKSSEKHANCDALCRLQHQNSTIGSESAIYQVSAIDDDFPITAKDIGKATKVDSVLCKVYYYIMSGWPENCQDENLRPYHNRKLELSCEQDCVLWDSRVVIPPVFREKLLNKLHWEHPVCQSRRYRTTPHSTIGVSPGELMMKRRLRTRLSLVKPDLAQVVEGKQEQQKVYKDGKGKSERTFEKEERVRV
ncbi:Hypothetical predicted protein [Paramuricea clavata]|uniref:Reverse transcriptase RNase H-like domain-containing protein n=1 Tax=Paramuricea clavata TaxID=317549 RepID=A0A7D9JMQ9_PARCT|nr:Hypothetical predicted protein [Paramuricea clavata]